jgi:hypothetical protein
MVVLLEKEEADSPCSRLFKSFPTCPSGTMDGLLHIAEELKDIIHWASEEVVMGFPQLPILRAVFALKCISWAAVELSVALVWPKNYTT